MLGAGGGRRRNVLRRVSWRGRSRRGGRRGAGRGRRVVILLRCRGRWRIGGPRRHIDRGRGIVRGRRCVIDGARRHKPHIHRDDGGGNSRDRPARPRQCRRSRRLDSLHRQPSPRPPQRPTKCFSFSSHVLPMLLLPLSAKWEAGLNCLWQPGGLRPHSSRQVGSLPRSSRRAASQPTRPSDASSPGRARCRPRTPSC